MKLRILLIQLINLPTTFPSMVAVATSLEAQSRLPIVFVQWNIPDIILHWADQGVYL